MYWLATRSAVVALPKWRSLSAFLSSPPFRRSFFASSPCLLNGQHQVVRCYRYRRFSRGSTGATKKAKEFNKVVDDKDILHLAWWKEKLQICQKTSTVQLVGRLVYSNLLGIDDNLKNGSLKEGSLNWEILQFKSKFPREVLLCRVGDFYEAIGIDACILVEYAGLNPFGGSRSDSIPRAGCPVVNLRQTLDDLTRNGYSVVRYTVVKQ